jgi:hypothetical protein
MWVEVGLEPLFLYAAAAEVDATTMVLPQQLTELARHERLHVRAAAIDGSGQLRGYSPHRTLREVGVADDAES